ncbi:MAG: Uma2 family endonuclease, partial [Armatimonadetes bacterium]|nr:Uma2 family endonuclease [Armatimonadota bacterium]
EGNNQLCAAPDVMVVFGRPKGDRDSYRQWEEEGIPPQVVFEIASGSNTPSEWVNKTLFYERFGVQEFYIYDPEKNTLEGYIRGTDGHLQPVEPMNGWVSPLLGIKFELQGDELIITAPDGKRFQVYEELAAAFDYTRQLLEQERQRAEQERQRAEQERQRAERLAQKLRELGVEID